MFFVPVAFSKDHKKMLAHCKEMLEYKNGQVAIHPKHTKLITALRTAVENGEGRVGFDSTNCGVDAAELKDPLTYFR